MINDDDNLKDSDAYSARASIIPAGTSTKPFWLVASSKMLISWSTVSSLDLDDCDNKVKIITVMTEYNGTRQGADRADRMSTLMKA